MLVSSHSRSPVLLLEFEGKKKTPLASTLTVGKLWDMSGGSMGIECGAGALAGIGGHWGCGVSQRGSMLCCPPSTSRFHM